MKGDTRVEGNITVEGRVSKEGQKVTAHGQQDEGERPGHACGYVIAILYNT